MSPTFTDMCWKFFARGSKRIEGRKLLYTFFFRFRGDDGDNFQPSYHPFGRASWTHFTLYLSLFLSIRQPFANILFPGWASILSIAQQLLCRAFLLMSGDPQRRFLFGLCWAHRHQLLPPQIIVMTQRIHLQIVEDSFTRNCFFYNAREFFTFSLFRFFFVRFINQNYIMCSSIHHTVTVLWLRRGTSGESPVKTTKKRGNEKKRRKTD